MSKCQSPLQDWILMSRLPLAWGRPSSMLRSTLKVEVAPCAHECSLVHRPCGSFCWNSNWGNHKTALFMEIIWSHSSLCNMETTCSWISKAMTAAEDHIFFQYHCFEGGKCLLFGLFWITDLTQRLQGRSANQKVSAIGLRVILWTKYRSLKPISLLFLITSPLI